MAHCNTIFHQMLKLIPRHVLGKLETEHGTGRKARTFTRWSQLVHLISMQLTARVSLREGISSLKARIKSLYHLGVKPVARSTFSDANNGRPASFFAAVFEEIMNSNSTTLRPCFISLNLKFFSLNWAHSF